MHPSLTLHPVLPMDRPRTNDCRPVASLVLVLLAASVGACDWPLINPLDPERCDPRCHEPQFCFHGQCTDRDAGPPDLVAGDMAVLDQRGPEKGPDLLAKDSGKDLLATDLPAKDLAVKDLAVKDLAVKDLAVKDMGKDLPLKDLPAKDSPVPDAAKTEAALPDGPALDKPIVEGGAKDANLLDAAGS